MIRKGRLMKARAVTFLAPQFFGIVVQDKPKALLAVEELAHAPTNLTFALGGQRVVVARRAAVRTRTGIVIALFIAHTHRGRVALTARTFRGVAWRVGARRGIAHVAHLTSKFIKSHETGAKAAHLGKSASGLTDRHKGGGHTVEVDRELSKGERGKEKKGWPALK
jgi:hypothetical protein